MMNTSSERSPSSIIVLGLATSESTSRTRRCMRGPAIR
jgi:hypothetical protein